MALGSAEDASSRRDRHLAMILRSSAALTGLVVVLIVGFLFLEAWPALSEVGLERFVTDPSWHPARSAEEGSFQLLPMVVGTFLLAAGALSLAAPLGLLSALFCQFYAPVSLGRAYRRLIEILAGVPSVVYGFWGLVTLVPLIRSWQPPGQSLLAGTLILALMILPTVALLAHAALRTVPGEDVRQAVALGLGQIALLRGVVLPHARIGILTGLFLALARALGETMAVLMVCGNIVQMPGSVFEPVRALTANIALEMAYAAHDHRSALFVSGLVLMGMVMALVFAIDRFERWAALD